MQEVEKKLIDLMGVEATVGQLEVWKYNLNYVIIGKGPVLLLLHGANIGWGMWYKNISDLAKHFTVIAVDLPWSGHSGRANFFGDDFENDVVRALGEFLNKTKFNISFVVGHSFGGWLAMKLFEEGFNFSKLVLVDSLGFSNFLPFGQRLVGYKVFVNFLAKTVFKPTREKMKMFLASVLNKKSVLSDAFVDYYFRGIWYGGLSHPLQFMHSLTDGMAIKKSLLIPKLNLAQLPPTLVIWGKNDLLVPFKKSEPALQYIPNKQLVFLDSGHVPALEQSEFFNEAINKFLLS